MTEVSPIVVQPPEIHIDLETRSAANLPKTGLYVYAEDPTTDVWCACWCVGDGEIHTWLPGEPVPRVLFDYVAAGSLIFAHNAGFEAALWEKVLGPRYGWPAVPFEQFRCTAAMAAAMALPRDLAGAAIAMGMDEQKDMSGKRLMMQLARPRSKPNEPLRWWEPADVPEKHKRLQEYCVQDVVVERELTKRLRPLSDDELAVFQLDHRINTRGVAIDLPSVGHAQKIVGAALDALNREVAILTRNAVDKVSQVARLTAWLTEQGVDVESLDKASLKATLLLDLPANVRRVLEIRQEAAKSSTAKLEAMRLRTNTDGRSRETLMYHGASTGRWSGKGIQLQNLPRPSLKQHQVEAAIAALPSRDPAWLSLWGPPLSVVSDALRGMIVAAPGHELVRADFSAIEGRVLAWLAGEQWKLSAYEAYDAGLGPDIYKLTASSVLGIPVEEITADQRQGQGKVPELFLGYGGGKGAFISGAKLYGFDVEEERAEEIKHAWRAANPAIVSLWYQLDDAAMNSVRNPGRKFSAGLIDYATKGGIMWCRLPSGRLLSYVDPKIKDVEVPWGGTRPSVTYMGVNSVTRKWERNKGDGGHWAENVTQAVARDVMVSAMLRVEARGWPIVLSVHDEVVSEVPAGSVSVEEYAAEMCVLPAWANGLPVTAEGAVGRRYGK